MTKEELEKEANKQSYLYDTKYSEDYTLEDRLNRPEDFVEGAIKDLVDLLKRKAYRDGYIAGAEPREKRIAELEKENADLKEKLTAIRNAKNKYDLSKDKSVIKALGAEYTLFCDLEQILEDWQEDEQLTKAKDIIEDLITKIPASLVDYFGAEKERAERFLGWEIKENDTL